MSIGQDAQGRLNARECTKKEAEVGHESKMMSDTKENERQVYEIIHAKKTKFDGDMDIRK